MPLKAFPLFSVSWESEQQKVASIKSISVSFTLRKHVTIVQLSSEESGETETQEDNPPGEGDVSVPWRRKLPVRPLGAGRLTNRHGLAKQESTRKKKDIIVRIRSHAQKQKNSNWRKKFRMCKTESFSLIPNSN